MPQSSGSVAALAGALAKAQATLVNPEKSLTATISGARSNELERTFRYASLASGLDVIRKALGQHEIATVQTTTVDAATGMINLTTTLAHASGEWIASDWPVCPTSETANPQLMGAALTYARRYALFTLVGIAGEDDLDAPDLAFVAPTPAGPSAGRHNNPHNRDVPSRIRKSESPSRSVSINAASAPLLPAESTSLREKLLAEIDLIATTEQAAAWAQVALPTKNRLANGDAARIEAAFARKISTIATAQPSNSSTHAKPSTTAAAIKDGTDKTDDDSGPRRTRIDKSVLTFGEPRRHRNKEHLRFVARQPCMVCGRKPSDPHHLRFMQPRALGLKVSDEFTVPLCRVHHRELHRNGDERPWWQAIGIDPIRVAQGLWQQSIGRSAVPEETDDCVTTEPPSATTFQDSMRAIAKQTT